MERSAALAPLKSPKSPRTIGPRTIGPRTIESHRHHWERFWGEAERLSLAEVYGTDGRILREVRRVRDPRGMLVLEVGAGSGRDSLALQAAGAKVFALDYAARSLRLIRSAAGTGGEPLRVTGGDGLWLPFPDSSLDLVFHQGLLEHFRDPMPLLWENLRVLKEGGLLLVDVPQRYHWYTVAKHALMLLGKWFAGWETEYSISELERLLRRSGLTPVRSYGHWMVPGLWYRGLRKALLSAFGWKLPMYPKALMFLGDCLGAVGAALRRWPFFLRLELYLAPVVGVIGRKERTL